MHKNNCSTEYDTLEKKIGPVQSTVNAVKGKMIFKKSG